MGMPLDVVRLMGDETIKGLLEAIEMLLRPAMRDGVRGVFASERARWRREGVLGWSNIVEVQLQRVRHVVAHVLALQTASRPPGLWRQHGRWQNHPHNCPRPRIRTKDECILPQTS